MLSIWCASRALTMNNPAQTDGAHPPASRQQRVHELFARLESTVISGAELGAEEFQSLAEFADSSALSAAVLAAQAAEQERLLARSKEEIGNSGLRAR